jgi:hypothetical protein
MGLPINATDMASFFGGFFARVFQVWLFSSVFLVFQIPFSPFARFQRFCDEKCSFTLVQSVITSSH